MSAKKTGNVGYTPLPALPKEEVRMTASEYQSQQAFFLEQARKFKEMFEDSTLAKWIIAAGLSGIVIAVVAILQLCWSVYEHFNK
jgi:hypothetical protein